MAITKQSKRKSRSIIIGHLEKISSKVFNNFGRPRRQINQRLAVLEIQNKQAKKRKNHTII